MRRHAVAADVKEFTHSSMKGFGDEYARNSGKFKFPDDPTLGTASRVCWTLTVFSSILTGVGLYL